MNGGASGRFGEDRPDKTRATASNSAARPHIGHDRRSLRFALPAADPKGRHVPLALSAPAHPVRPAIHRRTAAPACSGHPRASRHEVGLTPMDASEAEKLTRENEYLKVRIEQLQGEVWDLSGQLARSQQRLERSDLNRPESPPNPLSGGR